MTRRGSFLALAAAMAFLFAGPAMHAQSSRTINKATSTTMAPSTVGSDTLRGLEFLPGLSQFPDVDSVFDTAGAAPVRSNSTAVTRSVARTRGVGSHAESRRFSHLNPLLLTSFNGINHRDQRLANNGNQFSTEPPDQGLCTGNGFILETVNDALNVYDRNGNSLLGVMDLNSFYGYPAAFQRPAGPFGPEITDPSCMFDKQTQRWFHVVLTLDVDPTTGNFLGSNHLDLAVSATSNPLGNWNVYRLPVQNDGTDGTPNHHCAGGPCLGDYPHIGADTFGVYLTTNEFAFFGSGFTGAQIYALPKLPLALGAPTVPVVQFDTSQSLLEGNPGFTVWPSQPSGFGLPGPGDANGTEFLLSSLAVFTDAGTENRLRIWALRNTRSLLFPHPNVRLVSNFVPTLEYAVPPSSNQKPGDIPLAECINDTTMPTQFGPGCWQNLFVNEPAHDETEYSLDSNDSRMQQVFLADGKLYGALDTAVTVNGVNKAGIAYFIIQPFTTPAGVFGKVRQQEILGLANNNLTYPAIAALNDGRAVIAFTVVGDDHYPSAGYVGVDRHGAGDIQIAAEGLGPADGFSGYKAFGNPPRPRWGDYGAAATDGFSIWIASEYIGQTCTLAEYASAPFGSCGGTRTALANWGTRISRVLPGREF